jgi:hypothetical protein
MLSNSDLYKILDSLVLECCKKNANYKQIIGKAFSLGCDYKSEEIMEKISKIFNDGK